jgi:hypothetical protein
MQPKRRPGGCAVALHRDGIGKRVADEFRPHALFVVKALLEGQEAEHQVDRVAHAPHPALAPRPELRAHVLHRRNARRVQTPREPQVEVRRVDADEHVRALRLEGAPQPQPQPQQARQVAQHLEQPHHGERFGRLPHLAARVAHLRPGDAEEACLGVECPQRPDQARPERVARRLAGHQSHPQRHRVFCS